MKQLIKISHYSFVFFLISFISGIFLSNIIGNFYISIFILSIFGLIFVAIFLYSKKFGIFFVVSFFALLLGILYSNYNLFNIQNSENYLKNYLGKKLEMRLEIENIYKKTPDYTSYIAKLENSKNIKILLKIPGNYPLPSKTIIKTSSELEKIENFSPNFNYIKFMESKGVFATSYLYSYEKVGTYPKNKLGVCNNLCK